MNELHDTLILIGRLLGFAILLQSFEFINIKESISETGIWRWSELRSDYLFLPIQIQKILDWFMTPKHFMAMMILRFYIALTAIIFPHFILIFVFLFLTTFFITLRWRGSFNGGSDYLTLIILLCLSVGFLHPLLGKAALWYITIQVILSYFLAGIYKIKQKKWRNGTAVYGFVSSPSYSSPAFIIEKCKDPKIAKILAWMVILFELTFPLILIHPYLTILYLTLGIFFHLGNFLTFGLNRFFWIWSASYPALYYCSRLL